MPSPPPHVPARPSMLRRVLFQPDYSMAERPSNGRDRTLSLMEAGGETSWRAGEEEECNSYRHQPRGDTFRVKVSRLSTDVPLSCEVDLWDGKLVIGKLCEASPLHAAGARAGDVIAAANDCACETIEALKETIRGCLDICFVIVRRPATVLFASAVHLWLPSRGEAAGGGDAGGLDMGGLDAGGGEGGEWVAADARLLSTREIEIEMTGAGTCGGRVGAGGGASGELFKLSVRRIERLRSRGSVVEIRAPEGRRLTFCAEAGAARQWQHRLLQALMTHGRAQLVVGGWAEEVSAEIAGEIAEPSLLGGRLASGVASLLALAVSATAAAEPPRLLRFEAFDNGALFFFAGDGVGARGGIMGQAEGGLVLSACGLSLDPSTHNAGAVLLEDLEQGTRWRLHSLWSEVEGKQPHGVLQAMCATIG